MIPLLLQAIFIFQLFLFAYVILTFFPLEPGSFLSQMRAFLGNIFNPMVSFIEKRVPFAMRRYATLILFLVIILLQIFLQNLL